jgi:hypothetical protein
MGIERLIPRVTSLTVDCRGVNVSLTKAIYMEAFERQEGQAVILCEKKQHVIAVLLRSSL